MESTNPNYVTFDHLLNLLVHKSLLIQKYEYFGKQAKKDGFEQIAGFYTDTALQQTNHVKTLFRLLEGNELHTSAELFIPKISHTPENLKNSIYSEEQTILLIDQALPVAWDETQKRAHTKIKLFRQISEFYKNRFEKLLQNIEQGTVFRKEEKVKWICRKCGLIYESERALHNCPACEHPQAYFEILTENY